jgi:hypothetical protein
MGAQQPAVGYRNPLKRRNQDDELRGASKGPSVREERRRTQSNCNNGIRGRGIKE